MRRLYRERRYVCGDYLEVDIFPVFKKQAGRGMRAKPTSETQARLNEHNAEQQLMHWCWYRAIKALCATLPTAHCPP